MKIDISKLFGRGLLVAVLTLTSASGLVYQDSAIAGAKGAAASALGANNATERNNAKGKRGRFPGCCGAPARFSSGGGDDGSDGGDGGGDGYDDGNSDPDAF